MKLGLIGYPLGHSWSPEIHAFFLGEENYSLFPIQDQDLPGFFKTTDLDGFNVTIPHKQAVIPFLDALDPVAEKIGAVNTVVHRDKRFIGYNTDWEGLTGMIRSHQIDLCGRHAAILGSGGASKAAKAAVEELGGTCDVVSRHAGPDAISYDALYEKEAAYSVLINATPVGMSPNEDAVPADLSRFSHVEAVIDIVANPLRTSFLFEAKRRGMITCGGFEMLVRQALAADRYFTRRDMDEKMVGPCMNHLLKERRSIVLIGMPTCGKSTIAAKIHELTGRPLVEMDEEIEKRLGMTIRECFRTKGEAYFRSLETALAKELTRGNAVISCGGGIIKNPENMKYLSRNGQVFWINRDPRLLFGSPERPLSQSREDILRLYEERRDLYALYSDIEIANNRTAMDAVHEILSITGDEGIAV